ncbi:dihydrofolate reductase [Serratia phage 92A1]|nr:dihydrofolate reductase [Serratia phage 92A1]
MIQIVFATSTFMNAAGQSGFVFAKGNALPWNHIRQDFKNFQARTSVVIQGKQPAVVMGRKTFESLPGRLKNRFNVVISTHIDSVPTALNGDIPDTVICPGEKGLKGVCEDLEIDHGLVSVIGGKSLILDAAVWAHRIIHTVVEPNTKAFEGDIAFSRDEMQRVRKKRDILENHWFSIKSEEVNYIAEVMYADIN